MDDLVQITRYSRSEYYDLIGELDRRKKLSIFEPQLPLERMSKFVAESTSEASRGPIPECVTCGVCCAFALIVPVRLVDTPQLSEYWDVVSDETANEVVIQRVLPRDIATGRCSHLGGELGKEIACSIYPTRPSLCREFEAGSDRCHEYRRMYGIDPQLSENDLANEIASLVPPKTGIIAYAAITLDSVSRKVTFAAGDEGPVETTVEYMRIVAVLDDDPETYHDIHTYDANNETWFESDFTGLTLAEAQQSVLSRG